MANNLRRVCVFCASSTKLNPVYLNSARDLGIILAKNGISVVFGGQKNGLMGALADGVMSHNGSIVGIVPKLMEDSGWIHPNLRKENLRISECLSDRIMHMICNTDGVIVLPGGTGTFEELFAVLTLKRLAQYNKPIIIVDILDYFQLFDQLFKKSIEEKFMKNKHIGMYKIVKEVTSVVGAIRSTEVWFADDYKDGLVVESTDLDSR